MTKPDEWTVTACYTVAGTVKFMELTGVTALLQILPNGDGTCTGSVEIKDATNHVTESLLVTNCMYLHRTRADLVAETPAKPPADTSWIQTTEGRENRGQREKEATTE